MINYNSPRKILFHSLLFISISIGKSAFCQELSDDYVQLEKVVTKFQKAIEDKDSVAFNKLFFSDSISFIGIMSPKTEASIKKNYPEFEGVAVSNSRKFIREICNSPKKQVEKIYNIDINSEGNIATISFDYSFLSDNSIFQWGYENWNLVYVDEMWLITDVIYTIRFPKVEPFAIEE